MSSMQTDYHKDLSAQFGDVGLAKCSNKRYQRRSQRAWNTSANVAGLQLRQLYLSKGAPTTV